MLTRISLAIKDQNMQEALSRELQHEDHILSTISHKNILKQIGDEPCDMLIISEVLLPKLPEDFFQLVSQLPDTPDVVLLAQKDDEQKRVHFLALGCSAVLHQGLSPKSITEALRTLLNKISEAKVEVLQNRRTLGEPRLSDFVSNSQSMQTFINLAKRVTKSDSSLLILGETGVGKERLALAIHAESKRSHAPFIAINCAAMPDNLLESELFGHEQGAFTGASRMRRGAFEMAHKGTIFLDEIGDMPMPLQAKLLRVLQERKFSKLGGEKTIEVDIRIMAATNKDLTSEVEAGNFRKDLYYRLSVVTLLIPPLRERQEDINELVHSYIDYLAPRIGVEVSSISTRALEILKKYHWPGNVRELINVLERAMLLCESNRISINDLPEEMTRDSGNKNTAENITGSKDFYKNLLKSGWKDAREKVVDNFEKIYFENLLQENEGRISSTAKKAGITTRGLYEKMQKHNLAKNDFK